MINNKLIYVRSLIILNYNLAWIIIQHRWWIRVNWRSLPPKFKIPFLFKLNYYSTYCLKWLLYLPLSLQVSPWECKHLNWLSKMHYMWQHCVSPVYNIISIWIVIITAVFMLVDHSRDVACNVPTRFWLWWCSSSIWKPL